MKRQLTRWLKVIPTKIGLDHREHHQVFWIVLLIALISFMFSLAIELLSGEISPVNFFHDAFQGFGVEMAGALATFILVERIMDEQRQERQESERQRRTTDERQQRLIHDLGGDSHTQALRALEELKSTSWLYDESLMYKNLHYANLYDASLVKANFHHARLVEANFANADLFEANLSNANLSMSNLEHTNLHNANLEGANLRKCNLRNAKLSLANFDEETIMPNNEHWYDGIDLAMFTDPTHPEFWNPCEHYPDLRYCKTEPKAVPQGRL